MTTAIQPTSAPSTGNCARVRRYRAKHRRIDYVPSAEALTIIETWLGRKLDNCMVGVLDRLVVAGAKAISGNSGGR